MTVTEVTTLIVGGFIAGFGLCSASSLIGSGIRFLQAIFR